MEIKLLQAAEYHEVDLGAARQLWDQFIDAGRQRTKIPAGTSGHEIYKLKQHVLRLSEENPQAALDTAREVGALIDSNAELQRRRSDANAKMDAARLAAALATRKVLQGLIAEIGAEMNSIAVANETACLHTPGLLPARLVRLYERAKAIGTIQRDSWLSVPSDTEGYTQFRNVFDYVRKDLKAGVTAKCHCIL